MFRSYIGSTDRTLETNRVKKRVVKTSLNKPTDVFILSSVFLEGIW